MSAQQPEAIVRQIYEDVLNAGELELVRVVVAARAVDHAPHSRSSLPVGRIDSIEDFLIEFCTAFPDAYWTVEEVQADGDTVLVRTTVSGNHHAEFRGLRPGGRSFAITCEDIIRIEDGKIVEHWGELDLDGLHQQLASPPATVIVDDMRETERERRLVYGDRLAP